MGLENNIHPCRGGDLGGLVGTRADLSGLVGTRVQAGVVASRNKLSGPIITRSLIMFSPIIATFTRTMLA